MRWGIRGGAMGVLLCTGVSGCGGWPQAGGPQAGLVLPPASDGLEWAIDPGAWEWGRNDGLLNAGSAPPVLQRQWLEVRTRDNLRTTNGTPREHSTTVVRTVQRRLDG